MYRYSQQMRQNNVNIRLWNRILAVLLILALAGCGVMFARMRQSDSAAERTRQQLMIRVRACCVDTRNLAEKLSTSVQSNTALQLANIQQGIYAMDQFNSASMQLYGESGRLVPQEALTALYADMQSYFSIIQTSTVSVLEFRTLLLQHLSALQELLMEQAVE